MGATARWPCRTIRPESSTVVEEGIPDGGKIHQLAGVPSAFTPDYAPEEMLEIANKLYKASANHRRVCRPRVAGRLRTTLEDYYCCGLACGMRSLRAKQSLRKKPSRRNAGSPLALADTPVDSSFRSMQAFSSATLTNGVAFFFDISASAVRP